MNYLFILNPKSGKKYKADHIVNAIDQVFRKTKHKYDFVFTGGPGDATQLAKKGAKKSYHIITAIGGDGTVNEVATGIVQTDCALGIIPLGSGNGLARSFKIPLNLNESIKCLTNPDITVIDIGKINQHYFFGVCGIGLDAAIGKKFQEYGKRGPVPYFIIGTKEYFRYKPRKYIIKKNNKEVIEIEPLLITIANTNQYGNGAVIAPHADPKDGYLDVCIVYKIPVSKVLFYIPKLFNNTINDMPYYHSFKIKSAGISLDEDQGIIHTDGEPYLTGKQLKISLIRKALRICTPK